MPILPVLTYPAKSLKKPSREVKDFNVRLQDLVRDMFETMYVSGGIGLAAPQIGENIRLFVMDAGRKDPENPEAEAVSNRLHFVNPRIVHKDGTITYEEGCLSCPELLVQVDRAKDIVVESLDVEGRPQRHVLSELEAVCTQHEMDHLKGILLTDRISRLKREMYGKKLIREREGASDKSPLE